MYEDIKDNFGKDEKLRKVLQCIISFTGVNIEIIGCWFWIGRETYPYKNVLNHWVSNGPEKRKNGIITLNRSGKEVIRS